MATFTVQQLETPAHLFSMNQDGTVKACELSNTLLYVRERLFSMADLFMREGWQVTFMPAGYGSLLLSYNKTNGRGETILPILRVTERYMVMLD